MNCRIMSLYGGNLRTCLNGLIGLFLGGGLVMILVSMSSMLLGLGLVGLVGLAGLLGR